MQYNVILADPPWSFETWGKRPGGIDSRAAEAHYPTMTMVDLMAIGPLVQAVAADDSTLLLWTCPPLFYEAIDLVHAWGFRYKTKAFTWCKLYPQSTDFFIGMGYWTRANSEDVWLCTRGDPRRARKDVAQLLATLESAETPAVIAPNMRHSQKPEDVQDRIERLLSGPYLELFARRQRPGWTCLGNEIDGLDIRESLVRLAADQPLPIIERTTAQMELAL